MSATVFLEVIVSASYFGDYSEYEVRCQDTTVKLHTSEDVRLQERDQAWVYLPSNKIVILPARNLPRRKSNVSRHGRSGAMEKPQLVVAEKTRASWF